MTVSRHARSTGDGLTRWFEAVDGERVRISIFLAEPACETFFNRFISMPLPQSHLYFEPLCSHALKTINPLSTQGVAANFLKRAPRAAALIRAALFTGCTGTAYSEAPRVGRASFGVRRFLADAWHRR